VSYKKTKTEFLAKAGKVYDNYQSGHRNKPGRPSTEARVFAHCDEIWNLYSAKPSKRGLAEKIKQRIGPIAEGQIEDRLSDETIERHVTAWFRLRPLSDLPKRVLRARFKPEAIRALVNIKEDLLKHEDDLRKWAGRLPGEMRFDDLMNDLSNGKRKLPPKLAKLAKKLYRELVSLSEHRSQSSNRSSK
jgi:hypothetical protein